MLASVEKKCSPEAIAKYKTVIYYDKNQAHTYLPDKDTLYITTWVNRPEPNFNDKELRDLMRKHICPRSRLEMIKKPNDCLTVACHVRRGGGFLKKEEHMPIRKPLQFVPLHYYRDQIERLLVLYPEQKIYVHIFTDDKHPEEIVKFFNQKIKSEYVEYGYRKNANAHDKNVLEDFFSMMDFQVIIRPRSNFSKLAQYLGNHELVIIPASYYFTAEDTWSIDQVQISVPCSVNRSRELKNK
jgi:hypothetical protein